MEGDETAPEVTPGQIRAAGGMSRDDVSAIHRKLNAQDIELRRLREETNSARTAQRLAGLTDDEAKFERQAIAAETAERDKQTLLREKVELEGTLEAVARVEAARQIAGKHDIDPELIVGLPTPDAMERQAKKIRDKISQVEAEAKAKGAGSDAEPDVSDDAGGGGVTPKYDPKKFENTGSVADALKAKRQAGMR